MPDHDPRAHGHLLPPSVRAFLAEPHYASVATLEADGSPRQAVVWFRLDDDDAIVVNSRVGRRWPANLRRDGRVAVAVVDERKPTRWVGLTGRVETIIDDQDVAQADIAGLARRYDRPRDAERQIAEFRAQRRVTFRIRPLEIHDEL